ncbi:MAG: hypothetical protein K6F15_10185 [Treponema sp.]|nr:hypothetical protein [Treponema sp.]
MKKFLLGFLGFVGKWGGLAAAAYFGDQFFTEHKGKSALIFCILFIVLFIVGAYMKHKAKFTCWCGGSGDVIDTEYLGSKTSYTDTDNGWKKNITKKYLLTCRCNKCGKQWTTKSNKEITERHNFS